MAAETLVDRILALLHNNPLVAFAVVVGTVVIAASRFTDALKNLRGTLFKRKPPKDAEVTGEWTTDVLTNPFDADDTYRLTLSLRAQGQTVFGSLRQVSATPRSSYDVKYGVLDGRVEGDTLTFHTQRASLTSRPRSGIGEPPEWVEVPYKVFFRGTALDDELRFVVQDDRGNPPEQVTARRATP